MTELFVGRDINMPDQYNLGSRLCLQLVDMVPTQVVTVHEAALAPDNPAWLTGTPTLLVGDSNEVLRGEMALTYLQRLVVTVSRKAADTSERGRKAEPPARANQEEHAPADDDLWSSQIDDDAEGETVGVSGKVTTEDITRALDARKDRGVATPTNKPAPTPFKD